MTHTQFKIIVFIFMALIVYNLFRGLYFLVSGKENGRGTARSLSWRIALSVALFILLLVLKLTGVVKPHALNEKAAIATETPEPKKDNGKTLEEIQQQNNDGRIRLKP
jgi:hypothetical protein